VSVDLILVTSHYPYGAHDEFLSDEVAYLGAHFDRVTVAPMRPTFGQTVHALPANFAVDLNLADRISSDSRVLPSKVVRGIRRSRSLPQSLMSAEWRAAADSSLFRFAAKDLVDRADAKTVREWALTVNRPAVAYTFWLGSATVGLRRAWPKVPLVSRGHGSDIYPYATAAGLPMLGECVASVSALRAVSRHGRMNLRRSFPWADSALGVSRLGLSLPDHVARRSEDGTLRICSASSATANKRVGLIASLVLALGRCSPVQWTHFGPSPVHLLDRGLAKALEPIARFPGHVAQEDFWRHMESEPIDLFVNLSLSEGVPVSIIQAQAFGVPVLFSDVGGSREAAVPANNIMIPVDSTIEDMLSRFESEFIDNDEARDARRRHFISEFSLEATYPQWVRGIAGLCESGIWGEAS